MHVLRWNFLRVLGLCKGHKKTRGPRSRHPCLDSKKCSESCENRCFEGYVTLALKFSRRSVFTNSKISSGFLSIRPWGKRSCPGRNLKFGKTMKISGVCLAVDSPYSSGFFYQERIGRFCTFFLGKSRFFKMLRLTPKLQGRSNFSMRFRFWGQLLKSWPLSRPLGSPKFENPGSELRWHNGAIS